MIETLATIDWGAAFNALLALATAVSTLFAVLTGKQNKTIIAENKTKADLYNPYVPQTQEQTDLLEKEPLENWTMPDETIKTLHKILTDSGALLSYHALEVSIREKERRKEVEYGLYTEDHDGNGNTESLCAFISYGKIHSIGTYDEIRELARSRHAGILAISG